MKNLFLCISLLVSACATSRQNSERQPAATAKAEVHAVAKRLNALMKIDNESYGLENARVKDGHLIAPEGTNTDPSYDHNIWKKGFEDCREAAVNQALLDAGMEGLKVLGFRPQTSHRVYMPHIHPGGDEEDSNRRGTIRAIVTLAVEEVGGGEKEKVYSYILDDVVNRTCKVKRIESDSLEAKDRRTVEKDYLEQEIPNWTSKDRKAAIDFVKGSSASASVSSDALAEKMVGRLIEDECQHIALDQAVNLSAQEFRKKFNTEPVTIVDLPALFEKEKEIGFSIWIRVNMSDRWGNNGMITDVNVHVSPDVAYNKDKCAEIAPATVKVRH